MALLSKKSNTGFQKEIYIHDHKDREFLYEISSETGRLIPTYIKGDFIQDENNPSRIESDKWIGEITTEVVMLTKVILTYKKST